MACLRSIRLFVIRYWDLLQSPHLILLGLLCCVSRQNHPLKEDCCLHRLIHLRWILREVIALKEVIMLSEAIVVDFRGRASLVTSVSIVIRLATLLIGVMLCMDGPLLGMLTLHKQLHLLHLLRMILPPHLQSSTLKLAPHLFVGILSRMT